MKKNFIILFYSFISIFAYPQWKWQNPLPQGNGMNSIYFTDTNTGYTVGTAGTILKTSDGGQTWITYSSGPYNFLSSVFFTDANNGYVAGSNNMGSLIIKTDNAGTTWSPSFSGSVAWLNSIYFPDVNTGYAVGVAGDIVKTTNAGSTWTTLTSGTTAELFSVFFLNVNTGYAVGYNGNNGKGTIIKTTNGGITWDTLSSGRTVPLKSVLFTDSNTGYVVGDVGTILKTINAGTTWTLDTNGIGHMNMFDYFNSIYFTDSNTGYITDGSKNFIFKTTNAGGTWTPIGTDHGFSSVFFPAANIGYSLSWRVEKTMDAGVNWTDLYKGTNETLRSVSFPSATTGYAVGSADVEQPRTIIKTIDGGTNWTILSSGPQYEWLNSVFFTDVNTGYILDNRGIFTKQWMVEEVGPHYRVDNPVPLNLFSLRMPIPAMLWEIHTVIQGSS